MKTNWHVAVILGAAVLFHLLASVAAAKMSVDPSWYHYPLMIPVQIGLLFGRGGHDMNAIAGNMAWIVECLLVGLIVDGLIVLAYLKRQRA